MPDDRLTLLPDQIRSKIEIDEEAGCWLWTATINHGGYGVAYLKRKQYKAHRLVYMMLVGPITEETIDHLCRNTRCVNPDHLEPVSIRENILRSNNLQAQNARKTHCPRGHEYDEQNTRVYRGSRYCKTCQKATSPHYKRLYRERQRALKAAS